MLCAVTIKHGNVLGNDKFAGPLTQDILLDEYARELNFEGVRWPLLKRLGLLGERVKAHYGETKAEILI